MLAVGLFFFSFTYIAVAETKTFVCEKAGVKISVNFDETATIFATPHGKNEFRAIVYHHLCHNRLAVSHG
tara:strand:- start:557 stop:766 length:210 start_codon:yes stop_codon:yes gene_type:complete